MIDTIGLTSQTLLARSLRWFRAATPNWLCAIIGGPVGLIRISSQTSVLVRQKVRFGPVDVEIDPDLVLQARLSLPSEAKRDIKSATSILVETETPFAPSDLLIQVKELPSAGRDQDAAYRVFMLPREKLASELKRHNVKPAQVRSVFISVESALDQPLVFTAASRRLTGVCLAAWILPMALITFVALLLSNRVTAHQRQVAESLEASSTALLKEVADLQTQDDTAKAMLERHATASAFFQRSPSAYLALNALKRYFPAQAEITKIEIKDSSIALEVRTPDALADVRSLNALTGWTASIAGSIASDVTTGTDLATIVVTTAP